MSNAPLNDKNALLWTPLSLVKVCHVPVEVLLKACKNWDMTETRGHYCYMLHITPLTMGTRTSDVSDQGAL